MIEASLSVAKQRRYKITMESSGQAPVILRVRANSIQEVTDRVQSRRYPCPDHMSGFTVDEIGEEE